MRREPTTRLPVRAFDAAYYLGSEENERPPRFTGPQLVVLAAGTLGLLHALRAPRGRVVHVSRAYSELNRRRFHLVPHA